VLVTAIDPPADRLDSVSTRAAKWAPALAVFLAMLYAAGYLVVSTYVGAYGVRDFEPLRARYVAAGLTFCVFGAVIAFVGVRVFESVWRIGQKRGRRRFLSAAAVPATFIAVTVTAIYLLTQLRASGVGIGQFSWSYVGSVFSFSTGVVLLALIVRNRRHDWHT
jgi:hypothetical protein